MGEKVFLFFFVYLCIFAFMVGVLATRCNSQYQKTLDKCAVEYMRKGVKYSEAYHICEYENKDKGGK